jgi:hypothetical protein
VLPLKNIIEVRKPDKELPEVHLFTIFPVFFSSLSEIRFELKAPFAERTKGFQKKVNGLKSIKEKKIGINERKPLSILPIHGSVIVDNFTFPG